MHGMTHYIPNHRFYVLGIKRFTMNVQMQSIFAIFVVSEALVEIMQSFVFVAFVLNELIHNLNFFIEMAITVYSQGNGGYNDL